MHLRNLTSADQPQLLEALNTAFADYLVPFHLTSAQLDFKIRSESIRMDWSVGFFDEEKLVAFMLHGFRINEGINEIYNGGTGVLPNYRGQSLVGKMYHFIQPFFKEKEIGKMVLEVIEGNLSAIRAYEKNDFVISRKLRCLGGVLQVELANSPACTEPLLEYKESDLKAFWEISPSWQSDFHSVKAVKPTAIGAYVNREFAAYVLFSTANKRIYQIATAPKFRRKGIASQLLLAVQEQMNGESFRVNNIDEAALELITLLEKHGLKPVINQFEMIKVL